MAFRNSKQNFVIIASNLQWPRGTFILGSDFFLHFQCQIHYDTGTFVLAATEIPIRYCKVTLRALTISQNWLAGSVSSQMVHVSSQNWFWPNWPCSWSWASQFSHSSAERGKPQQIFAPGSVYNITSRSTKIL